MQTGMSVKLEPLNHSDILADLNSSLLTGGYDDAVLSAAAAAGSSSSSSTAAGGGNGSGSRSRSSKSHHHHKHQRHHDHKDRGNHHHDNHHHQKQHQSRLSHYQPQGLQQQQQQHHQPEYDPGLGVTSRKARTKVYAGHSRAAHYDHVPRLEDLCLSLLADNLDKITCLGDAPFYLMAPVLSKCTPNQLKKIDKHNPHLRSELDELWKVHAEVEFRDEKKNRSKRESWRDFFTRATAERESRLMKITKKIQKKSVKDNEPVKKTLVVDSVPQKGRRLPAGTKSAVTATAVSAAEIRKSAKDSRVGSAAKAKHRTGPLMAKTMAMFKQRFRR